MSAPHPPTPYRRAPQRKRGEARVEVLLRAAAEVFAEVGVPAATTNQIAARAQTSIGSLYQFFPNKEALVEAVAARYRADLHALFDALLSQEAAALPLAEIASRQFDALLAFAHAHPGFAQLFLEPQAAAGADARALQQEIVERITAALGLRFRRLSARQRRVQAVLLDAVMKALLRLLLVSAAGERRLLLAEGKALLAGHLARVAELDAAAAGR